MLKYTCRKLSCSSACKKSTLSLTSLRYCKKKSKLVILGTLGKPSYTHPKHNHLVENVCIYLQAKEPLQPHVFLEILHRCASFLFWILWHVRIRSPKMVLSTCKKFYSFSATKNKVTATGLEPTTI